ncbi:MAG TPA: YfiR family protein, partial [Candidatus Acidoferrales bacterium]|nr:YfiR family protein [Candidatus Acidoferrales bacterium]
MNLTGPHEAFPRSVLARKPRGVVSFWLVLLLAISEILPFEVQARQKRPTESQIEAIYLFNFTRFIEWPPDPAAAPGAETFSLCVLGEDPFGKFLDATIAGERVGEKSFVARRISKPEDALDCRILFVSTSEQDHLKELFDVLANKSVLTVSDIPRFAERGGMIEFVMAKDKVRFEINLTSATEAGLTLSSDLLKVAVAVHRDAHGRA